MFVKKFRELLKGDHPIEAQDQVVDQEEDEEDASYLDYAT